MTDENLENAALTPTLGSAYGSKSLNVQDILPSRAYRSEEEEPFRLPHIGVFGIGGGGCNAVENLSRANLSGVELVAMDTDFGVLRQNSADTRVRLGEHETRGSGAGNDSGRGRHAAEATKREIEAKLKEFDLIFILSSLGGGTGSGAVPVIARIAQSMDIPMAVIVTLPFPEEGKRRNLNAKQAVEELENIDCVLVTIPNEKIDIFGHDDDKLEDRYRDIDSVAENGIRSIVNTLIMTGHQNVDFADISRAFRCPGPAMITFAAHSGDNRVESALSEVIDSKWIDIPDRTLAQILTVIIVADRNTFTRGEQRQIYEAVCEAFPQTDDINYGIFWDDSLNNALHITLIATGVTRNHVEAQQTKETPSTQPRPVRAKNQSARETVPEVTDLSEVWDTGDDHIDTDQLAGAVAAPSQLSRVQELQGRPARDTVRDTKVSSPRWMREQSS